jgi:hypothetical protein
MGRRTGREHSHILGPVEAPLHVFGGGIGALAEPFDVIAAMAERVVLHVTPIDAVPIRSARRSGSGMAFAISYVLGFAKMLSIASSGETAPTSSITTFIGG